MKRLLGRWWIVALMLGLVFCAAPARAGSGGNEWKFQVAPYAWLAGLKGSTSTLPGLPAANINIDFYDDVLGNLNGALMLLGEVQRGRLGFVADVAYTDIESSNSTPGPFFSSADTRSKTLMISGSLFYRLLEKQRGFLDVFGGARYWSLETDLSLTGGVARPRNLSHSESWTDPLVGLKGLLPLGGSKFFLSGFALTGGFGVGSDFMYDLNANLGYQLTETFALTFGYRYLYVDYENDGFKYDVTQQGPILGFSWRF
ncbi:MAG: hypothetical protein KQH53_05080 [Desulfarculaceae bacterium]|nr:hypothetical protein [Desulfarculaceae bacterium]